MPKEQKQLQTRKKKSQNSSNQAQKEESLNFSLLERTVFSEKGKDIYIGGDLLSDQMRSLLRDQAKIFQTSNLYEILNSTIINESISLAFQAGTQEHTQYAKALYYWSKTMKKIIDTLAK